MTSPSPYRAYQAHQLAAVPGFRDLPADIKHSVKVAACVFPFKVSNYLISELIDWNRVPDDPVFRIAFPVREMLAPQDQAAIAALLANQASREEIAAASHLIRRRLNPNPADQKSNVPIFEGRPLAGVQHKYASTVLWFPSGGQTCHCHCSFCFRWSQFAGMKDEMFACDDLGRFYAYVAGDPAIADVLLTGGDPMVMSTANLERLLKPLMTELRFAHVQSIRFGTKALSFWPYRFTSGKEADDLLRLFEALIAAGKHVALMAHFNHHRELETPVVQQAIRRIRSTGAIIRTQGPLLAGINDDAAVWRELWRKQVACGLIPYYMFMERDTGAWHHFAVPIVHALAVYRGALSSLSGLARTVRGPVMSTSPGKIEVLGVIDLGGRAYLSLRFLQARRQEWEHRQFLADFSPAARWIDELRPAFDEPQFFFANHERITVGSSAH